ncbi:MAG TPA: bacterioferritin-associated ferredoxin [Alphaproteobacteria bacterium]|nr:bacterioferritin-associated ferredoxin [Alphaproteobacteria bacterium]
MYVCICNAFTCSDVRRVKSQGVSKSKQVYKKLGCRMECGKCLETIDNVLKEEQTTESFANKALEFNNISSISI